MVALPMNGAFRNAPVECTNERRLKPHFELVPRILLSRDVPSASEADLHSCLDRVLPTQPWNADVTATGRQLAHTDMSRALFRLAD